MKRFLLLWCTLLLTISCYAQSYEIVYHSFFENKRTSHQNATIVFGNINETWLFSEKSKNGKAELPYQIHQLYHQEKPHQSVHFGFLKNNKIVRYDELNTDKKYTFNITKEYKNILGYRAQKATTSVNSNHIEVWFTKELPLFSSPKNIGQHLGCVLEIRFNGNRSIKAMNIKQISSAPSVLPTKKNIKKVDQLTYKDLLWKSRFTSIPIFKNDSVYYSNTIPQEENKIHFSNGTVLLKKVKFPKFNPKNLVFLELSQKSNGDAYDRTGSIFMLSKDEKKSFLKAFHKGIKSLPAYTNESKKEYRGMILHKNFEPNLELMRFFTPFGIEHFNHIKIKGKKWHHQANYKQDISDLSPFFNGQEVWVGIFISNYDKGGHIVDVNLNIHDSETSIFKSNFVLPLINTVNIMEMSGQGYATLFNQQKGASVRFHLEHPVTNAKLRYIVTGHGGWENGDEFIPQKNTIFLDHQFIHQFIPWRTDCGSYRAYNPASGNFNNGMSSSDYSRSNWCPGTTTNPYYVSLGNLSAGTHHIKIVIPQGKNEGNSFSYWNVSASLIGNQSPNQ